MTSPLLILIRRYTSSAESPCKPCFVSTSFLVLQASRNLPGLHGVGHRDSRRSGADNLLVAQNR